MKKYLILSLCVVMALLCVACKQDTTKPETSKNQTSFGEALQENNSSNAQNNPTSSGIQLEEDVFEENTHQNSDSSKDDNNSSGSNSTGNNSAQSSNAQSSSSQSGSSDTDKTDSNDTEETPSEQNPSNDGAVTIEDGVIILPPDKFN